MEMFAHLTTPSTDKIKKSMDSLLQFLQMTTQISGAHTVEFYTQDIWKNLVAVSPESVLSIFSQQKPHHEYREAPDISSIFSPATKQLVNLESFVEAAQYNSLMSLGLCTPVDELFETFAAQRARKPDSCTISNRIIALHDLSSEHVKLLYEQLYAIDLLATIKQKCPVKEAPDISSIFSPATKQLVNLESFVEAAQYNSLMSLGLCTPVDELFETFAAQRARKPDHKIKTDQFMNDKKSHEVVLMSQLVEALTNVYGVKQVIDVGAGKGYLSSYLSMHYGLKVYGIDSSHINTDGANKRNRKLKKYWQVYKTDARTTSKAKKSDQKKEGLLLKNSSQDVIADQDISRQRRSAIRCTGLSNSESDYSKWTSNEESNQVTENTESDNSSDSTFSFLDILPAGAVEVPSMSQSISKVLSEQEKEQRKMENIKAKKFTESHVYSPLTSYVTADTELHDIIADLEKSIMVGLHTCGDLAPNTLRIFISKPEIKAVCSVGCCYHFLSEQFDPLEEEQTEGSWGFPMSQYLKERSWHVGRNARMSACLALERVAVGQGLPTESLFYRAVFQVICKEVYDITQSDQRVGKIFSKSSSFTDYVRKSLKKFGQDDSKLSDKEIMGYYQKYDLRRNELEAFNRLKVFLAPCIEALILLDRLSYLREQENTVWSGVVKLFDPVKSPRCYAVVSLKQP
ncbi:methyltransferase-like protein 25 [Bufo gargarizans]|uniref:methyltransferase-like protein 25 n=1 Tax=Bufo gargarizans TaxID=30331 RepID=UPI001CF3B765|nr:methyltransferase-like protein 25 [Bufo gargarizans]